MSDSKTSDVRVMLSASRFLMVESVTVRSGHFTLDFGIIGVGV